MPSYWRVSPKFWADPKVLGWNDDARYLALYILTCPHRSTEGLFRLPRSYVLADLGWTPERLAEPFRRLLVDGFIEYDEVVQVCLIVKALEYQAPENPNQVTAALRQLEDLPPAPALDSRFRLLAERFCQRLAERLPEWFGKPPSPSPAPSPTSSALDSSSEQPASSPSASSPSAKASAGFAEWWMSYPRKVCKADAEKAYVKAIKRGATCDELTASLAQWRHQWRRENRPADKIPHAATWLNQDRWKDDLSQPDVSYEPAPVRYV